MRNLKRALSLVLAAMMLISMMVVSAGAASKDFTDKDEITHTEAVSAMTTLNVIAGKGDGSYFDPTGTLTRAEMAKLVTYILNGGVEPVLGEKVTPTYKDIDGHWAEAYIEYCTSMNIIAGDGTGKFNPEGTLTAEQCAKMLLTAMNYKDDIFGFLGNNWAINVNREANAAGLYDELGGLAATAPISRDDAAQMVYNAIQAKTMELTWSRDMQTGEITQTYQLVGDSLFTSKFNGIVYEGVLRASGSVAPYGISAGKEKLNVNAVLIDGDRPTGGSASITVNYAEDVTGMIGEYVKVLYNSKDKVAYGVYSVADENNIVINTTVGALSNVGTPTANTLKYDGTTYDVDAGANAYMIRSDATVVTLAITDLDTDARVANYDNVKLVDNDGDDKIDVAIVIENQVEQVTYVGSDSITLTSKGQVKAADAHYSDLAVDDYVSYTSTAANYDGKLVVTKAVAVSGEVTEVGQNASTRVNKVKVDGEWYTLGQDNGSNPYTDTDTNELDYKVSYDLYLINNYVVKAEKIKGSNVKVAVVTGTTGATDYDGNHQARLLLADGTSVEGYVDIAVTTGNFIAYTVEGSVYKAVAVATGTDKQQAGYDHVETNSGLSGNAFNSTTALLDGRSVDKKVNKDAVVFVHYDKDSATPLMQDAFMVITGAELNSWKSNWGDNVTFLYNDSGLGYADVVYIEGGVNAVIPGVKSSYGYITSGVTEGQDADGVYSSFTLWDGTNSYNVIARKSISALGAGKGNAIKFEWDGENVVKDVTVLSAAAALVYSNGEQVKLVDGATNNGYDLADDVTIINVSTKDYAGVAGNAIATAAQTSNTGVYNFNCWYVYDAVDQEIDVLIIDVTSNKLANTGAGLTYDMVP